jgi:hypothetical protein
MSRSGFRIAASTMADQPCFAIAIAIGKFFGASRREMFKSMIDPMSAAQIIVGATDKHQPVQGYHIDGQALEIDWNFERSRDQFKIDHYRRRALAEQHSPMIGFVG